MIKAVVLVVVLAVVAIIVVALAVAEALTGVQHIQVDVAVIQIPVLIKLLHLPGYRWVELS
jgi:hypothetical protein